MTNPLNIDDTLYRHILSYTYPNELWRRVRSLDNNPEWENRYLISTKKRIVSLYNGELIQIHPSLTSPTFVYFNAHSTRYKYTVDDLYKATFPIDLGF